jgi:predicted RecA/RadA family phage recombinase
MKNFVQDGNVVTVTSPGGVESGDVVVIGNLVGVAACDADTNDDIELALHGVFTLAKNGAAIEAGDKLYWDAAAKECIAQQSTLLEPYVGTAVDAAGSGAATVDVLIGYPG